MWHYVRMGPGQEQRKERSRSGSLTAEMIWQELGLPGTPPQNAGCGDCNYECDAQAVRNRLKEKREKIEHSGETRTFVESPAALAELGLLKMLRRFNDTDVSPEIDYALLIRYVRNDLNVLDGVTVDYNLEFRDWWKAHALVQNFVDTIRKLSE